MGFFELLLGVSVAGAAFAAVFARRKGSSWWNVLGLIAPLLGLAGFASAFAFLGEVKRDLGGRCLYPAYALALVQAVSNDVHGKTSTGRAAWRSRSRRPC